MGVVATVGWGMGVGLEGWVDRARVVRERAGPEKADLEREVEERAGWERAD